MTVTSQIAYIVWSEFLVYTGVVSALANNAWFYGLFSASTVDGGVAFGAHYFTRLYEFL